MGDISYTGVGRVGEKGVGDITFTAHNAIRIEEAQQAGMV